MGCYTSKPDDNVYITEGKGRNFVYATASCQGWRREQEDAEVCIPDFDDDASLFILCDGHGGAEVAKYTVQHLPDFLKNHPLYKQGNYKEALYKVFMEFDSTLIKPEVLAKINKISLDGKEEDLDSKDESNPRSSKRESLLEAASGCSPSKDEISDTAAGPSASSSSAGPSTSNGADSIVEDVDAETLRREASMPIEELINKYADQPEVRDRIQSLRKATLNMGVSPVIRKKDSQESDSKREKNSDDNEASSSANVPEGRAEPSLNSTDEDGPSSSMSRSELSNLLEFCVSDDYLKNIDGDSDDDSEFTGTDGDESDDDDDDDDEEDDDDDDDDDEDEDEDEDDNEDALDDDDEDGDDERDEEQVKGKSKRLLRRDQRKIFGDRGEPSSEEDESSSDEMYQDDEADESNDKYENDEDDEEVYGTTNPQQVSASYKLATKVHRPVYDSGCTVVVALVKGDTLYVASAGDSRCIAITRDGTCHTMSFDHKPEDPSERRRIRKAGGDVIEGRVNGGLNLSRAFGDFTYKDTSLDAEHQMITPCPGYRELKLDFDEIEYIFLACDGIWNSLENEPLTKFVHYVAPTVHHDLAQICKEVFKSCLAPTTDGDGTGCDNMTCIIARYARPGEQDSSTTKHSDLKSNTNSKFKEENEPSAGDTKGTNKRTSDKMEGDDQVSVKRRCIKLLED